VPYSREHYDAFRKELMNEQLERFYFERFEGGFRLGSCGPGEGGSPRGSVYNLKGHAGHVLSVIALLKALFKRRKIFDGSASTSFVSSRYLANLSAFCSNNAFLASSVRKLI